MTISKIKYIILVDNSVKKEKEGDCMSDYGLKTTITAVINEDKYDIGFTFDDSKGNSLDKRLNGDINNIEQDIMAAILEEYLNFLKQEQKSSTQNKFGVNSNSVISITEEPQNIKSEFDTRFAELEEENRRLNDKINSILTGKTSTSVKENKKEEKKTTMPDMKKTMTAKLSTDDILKMLRILGY